MKILFLHLSDAHFKNNDFNQSGKINKMVDSLSCIGNFDECIIIFSGDVAFSGQDFEYTHAEHFLGKLIKNIREKLNFSKPIFKIIVPGNHDINFDMQRRNREDISKLLKSNVSKEEINNELNKMNSFFIFANLNHCYKDENKLVEIKYYNFQNFKIRFNLINSAMFSIYKDNEGDNDKGLHFLRHSDINELEKGSSVDLEITVQHHPLDWYHTKIEKSIYEAVHKYSAILFVGHEHYNNVQGVKSYRNGDIEIYNAGALIGDNGESFFSSILIDTNSEESKVLSFEWDDSEKVYSYKELESELFLRKRMNNGLKPNLEFLNELLIDESTNQNNFLDYFIFPRLSMSRDDKYLEDKEIVNKEDFFNKIKNAKICHVEGFDLSGKTTFIKYLFTEFKKDKAPLYFDIKSLDKVKINKICKNVFREQYNENEISYNSFMQLNKNQRIALIDDADKCEKGSIDEFINEYKDFFGLIILVNSTQFTLNFKEKIKEILEYDKKEILRFKILPYYSDKRKELMRTICKINNPYISEYELTNKVELLDSGIKNQLTMFTLYPNFIIMYANFFDNPAAIPSTDNKNIFNAVFQANITKILQKQDKIKVDTVIFLLQKIAYNIHISRFDGKIKYPLPFSEFVNIIEDYNKQYDGEIKSTDLAKILIDSRIMKQVDKEDKLIFVSKNYQSYFVAKELNDKIPSDEGYNVLQKIAENICFGINAEILLFLCFLTGKNQILEHILSEADKLMLNWEEADFNLKNIKFITKDNKDDDGKYLEEEDIQNKHEKDIEQEKYITRNHDEIRALSIYDYDESTINSFVSIQQRAFRFIEIISKALPNFEYRLQTDLKNKFINAIYKNPNKLIKYILDPIDKNHEKLIKEALEYFQEYGKKTTETEVESYLLDMASTLILNIYDFSVRIAVDENTIRPLDKFDYSKSKNYQLMNLMMFENLEVKSLTFNKTLVFNSKAEMIYDNNNDVFIDKLIRRIVHKHYLSNKVGHSEKAQHFADKFFTSKHVVHKDKNKKNIEKYFKVKTPAEKLLSESRRNALMPKNKK